MFSGIITDLGKITFLDLNKKTIEINTNFKDLFLGQSISCSGVCLTVAEVKTKICKKVKWIKCFDIFVIR